MEDRKLILWRNIDLSKTAIKNYKEILDSLLEDFKDFPSYAIMFIFPDKAVFKGKFYKELLKKDRLVKIERLNRKQLVSFVGKRFNRANKKIKNSLIDDIIDRFSYLNKDSEIKLYDVVNTIRKNNSQF